MGEISYSVYLIHGVVIWLIMGVILPRLPVFHPTFTWLIGSGIVMVPILILVTSASYLAIERPFIAIGHGLSKRVAP
jgi:peptidoglycan/LPS O-acetylase OafA/YrhL